MRIGNYMKDGIDYEIKIQQDGDDFMAVWTCLECGDTGQTSPTYMDAERATSAAKALLFSKHHIGAHLAAKIGIP